MYRHKIIPFGKFQKQQLINESTGNSFTIAPERGATLLDLCFSRQSILDGCSTPLDLDLNKWGKSAILVPFPNRLRDGKFNWLNRQYQFPINDTLTDNAIHGFMMDKEMEVTEIGLHENSAYIKCSYRYMGNRPFYPFPFDFFATFEISDHATFQVTFSIENTGRMAFPVGMGWHPYFKLSDKVDNDQLRLDPCKMVGVDQRMLPTGKKYDYDVFEELCPIKSTVLDNCFAISPDQGDNFTLDYKGQNGHIRYWQELGKDRFNFVQLFTPPERQSLAVEPMTCNVDALNNEEGLKVLQPKEAMSASFGLSYTLR